MIKNHTLASTQLLHDSGKIIAKLVLVSKLCKDNSNAECWHLLHTTVVVECNVVSSMRKTAILLQASVHCEHGVQKALPKYTSRSTLFVTRVQGLGQGEAGEGAHCQQQNWT